MEQNIIVLENSVEQEPEPSDEKLKREKVDCSHRVIEKRRRDRINNSLLQLSKLVPIEKFNKKNSGKLEKAEILEVTVHYLTQQQFEKENATVKQSSNETSSEIQSGESQPSELPLYLRGFKQCITDATKFFQEVEELDVSEGRCYRLIQHLRKQISRYENNERELPKVAMEERLVWDNVESSENSSRRISADSNLAKRKNGGDQDGTSCKKPRTTPEGTNSGGDQASGEQDRSSSPSNTNSDSFNNADPNSLRNYMPFVFPNIPLFTTMPFAGANNMPRFQAPQSQFPGYQYQQSTPQYIPVALPQFPMMGMNFVPGFGMVNGEQSQNGGMPCSVANTMPLGSGVASNGMMPSAIPNGFFPSMYSNGLHANIVAMRPRDSGYESSEKSSSSKASGSETSPQSFSDDSCQSYAS